MYVCMYVCMYVYIIYLRPWVGLFICEDLELFIQSPWLSIKSWSIRIYMTRQYIRTYVHTYIGTYVHTFIRTYVHMYIRTYIRTYLHTYVHTHTHIHTYIWIYVDVNHPYGPPILEDYGENGLDFSLGFPHYMKTIWVFPEMGDLKNHRYQY